MRIIQFSFMHLSLLCLQLIPLRVIAEPTLQEQDIKQALLRLQHYEEMQQWQLETTSDTMTFTSRFGVNVSSSDAIAELHANASAPHVSESEMPVSESFGIDQKPFRIHIHFIPFPEYATLEQLQQQRHALVTRLNHDAFDLDSDPMDAEQWEHTWEKLHAQPFPTHVAGHSLVSISSDLDNPKLSFEPNQELKECIWMLYRLGFLFSEIVR